MKKKLICVIPLSILFIVFAISISSVSTHAKERTYNSKHLIAELKKEKIQLYYDKKAEGMFEGFYLKSGNKVKYFNWKNIVKPSFYPEIHLLENNYIAVICVVGEGTGVDIQQLHLLNRKTFKVITFENPVDIVKSNVTFDLQAPNINVKIKDQTWSTVEDIDLKNFFDSVYYQNIITYTFDEDAAFAAILPVQVSSADFIGKLRINYTFEEKESKFVPSDINFNFFETNIK